MAINVLGVHTDHVRAEQAAGNSLAVAYSVAVLCWLLSSGVYIAAKWVSHEMPPWALCFWRVLIACAILLPIVHHHFGEMLALVRTRGLELLFLPRHQQGRGQSRLSGAEAAAVEGMVCTVPAATVVVGGTVRIFYTTM